MINPSLINGFIAGSGITLALMSIGFLYYIGPVENYGGVSSTEIRVAIMLGGLVAAVSLGYQYYSNQKKSQNNTEQDDSKTESQTDETK